MASLEAFNGPPQRAVIFVRSDIGPGQIAGGREPPADEADWLRTIIVRQYNLDDYMRSRARGEEPTALPGNAPAQTVHLKEITVEIARPRETGLAGVFRKVWHDTYRLQDVEGLALHRFDTLFITAEVRAGPPTPRRPAVMVGSLALTGR